MVETSTRVSPIFTEVNAVLETHLEEEITKGMDIKERSYLVVGGLLSRLLYDCCGGDEKRPEFKAVLENVGMKMPQAKQFILCYDFVGKCPTALEFEDLGHYKLSIFGQVYDLIENSEMVEYLTECRDEKRNVGWCKDMVKLIKQGFKEERPEDQMTMTFKLYEEQQNVVKDALGLGDELDLAKAPNELLTVICEFFNEHARNHYSND